MMGKVSYILAGSRQAREALSYHLLDPEPATVTSAIVRPYSS